MLTADGNTALLTLKQPKNAAPKEAHTSGLFHFAILLPTRANLSAFLRNIASSGVQIGASDHYVSEAHYLSDPDGNGIEVYHDRPSSEWSWTENEVTILNHLTKKSYLPKAGKNGMACRMILSWDIFICM